MKFSLEFVLRLRQMLTNFIYTEKNRSWVRRDKATLLTQLQTFQNDWRFETDFFCTGDKTPSTGFDRHYVYHPAWAFRKLVQDIKPEKHVDISSTLHFCSMLSAIIPVDFYDYRPADLTLGGLLTFRGDLNRLPFENKSVHSISCMHTVEHIGLGRYGDKVDAFGDQKAMRELQRVVAIGGSLLFVVPVGDANRLYFNAHRVYKPEHVVSSFPELTLEEYYYIPAKGGAPLALSPDSGLIENEKYGCGCFWFKRDA